MKNFSRITSQRIWQYKLARYNPIRSLDPAGLSSAMDEYNAGYLKRGTMIFDLIERRDPTAKSVIGKRKQAAAGFKYEVVARDGAEKGLADKQTETVKYCLDNLTCTRAIDRNFRRTMPGLFELMLDSHLHGWSCFETLWEPSEKGITVSLVHIPPWFFENRDGILKYLKEENSLTGEAMAEGEWMVCTGLGLGEATATAWMFKHLPLQDWLIFCEKNASPGIVARTTHRMGTDEYNALKETIALVGVDWSAIIDKEDEIEALDFSGKGAELFEKMVTYMDKAIMILWRGSDLSTKSSEKGVVGAMPQVKEGESIEDYDARLIGEYINEFITKYVLKWKFGEGVEQLVDVKISPSEMIDPTMEMEIDGWLIEKGAPVGIDSCLERLNRSRPGPKEEIFEKPEPMLPAGAGIPGQPPARKKIIPKGGERAHFGANAVVQKQEALLKHTMDILAGTEPEALRPLTDRLNGLLELEGIEAIRLGANRLLRDLPQILREVNARSGDSISTQEGALLASILNGMATAAVRRSEPPSAVNTRYYISRGENGEITAVNARERNQ